VWVQQKCLKSDREKQQVEQEYFKNTIYFQGIKTKQNMVDIMKYFACKNSYHLKHCDKFEASSSLNLKHYFTNKVSAFSYTINPVTRMLILDFVHA